MIQILLHGWMDGWWMDARMDDWLAGSPDRSCVWRLSRWWILKGQNTVPGKSRQDSPDKGQSSFKVVTEGILSHVTKLFEKSLWRKGRQDIGSSISPVIPERNDTHLPWSNGDGGGQKWVDLSDYSRAWQPRSTRKGQGKLDWHSGAGLGRAADGGARLRIREYKGRR